jgi:hypothetical protein
VDGKVQWRRARSGAAHRRRARSGTSCQRRVRTTRCGGGGKERQHSVAKGEEARCGGGIEEQWQRSGAVEEGDERMTTRFGVRASHVMTCEDD